jgi:hypothetical protein
MQWKRAEDVKLPGLYVMFDMDDVSDSEFPNVVLVMLSKQDITNKLFVTARGGFVTAIENYIDKHQPSSYIFFGPLPVPFVGEPE